MGSQHFIDAVNERVVVFDGAFGTYVQGLDLTADDFGGASLEGCNEMLCLTRPDVIRAMHSAFFEVGVDAVETASFGSFSQVLAEYDVADKAYELNVAAARLAREVADDFSTDGRSRYVAGSIGPGTKMPSLGHVDFASLRDSYQEQAAGLLEGGADLFLIETCFDLLQTKAAISACRRAMKAAGREVPLQVQVTMETTGRMLLGSEIGAALVSVGAMRPDVLGINCATGPAEMQEHLRYLSQHSPFPISVLPNAGLPSIVDGRTHYDLTPEALAEFHKHHVADLGVAVVGGCCGTTPEHLRQVVEAVKDITPTHRSPEFEPSVTSIYTPVTLKQDLSVLLIGERTNANGSKAFREAMLASDWDTCVKMANEQIKEGAHVLDVCVDYVGRDGTVDMDEIAKRFATQASVPLVLDSTEPEVLEAALMHVGGRAILNSANLEDGELPGSRLDRVFSLARDYGAAVICLLIDERGQARDVEWKMEIAHRINEIATERYGLQSSDLIFDALTFPLSTGDDDLRRDAIETMEAIKRIKAEIPGASTTLGLSNVSFGLSPASRHALNSVFLHECVEAGLDSAIVHAGKIVPLNRLPEDQREVCLDLVWDRRRPDYDPLAAFLEVFADVKSTKTEKPDRSGMPVEERLKLRIIDGDREGLSDDLDEALASGIPALNIVNDVLLEGMKVVGELFGSGQMQLPFVLQSAETMKTSVAYLEPHMDRVDGSTSKGKLVIATVKGDVHDIGKNLVDIIATNNGYEVFNLGIKVPIGEMVAKVKEVDADALGMSGLLVKSTLIMRDNLEELNSLGLSEVPVLLGGAALTRRYVERDLREIYEGRLFYGRDAFEGLSTLDSIMTMKRSGEWDPDFGVVPTGRVLPEREGGGLDAVELPRRSPSVAADNEVFTPPFIGSRVVKGIPLDDIVEYVNETALYRNQWQFRPEKVIGDDGSERPENDEEFKTRIRATFREQLAAAKASGVLVPQVVYGYFPANGDGDDLVIWTDESRTVEAARFHYPRQKVDPFLCIADFFRPIDGGPTDQNLDYAAFHIVTMGSAVSEETARLFAANEYQQYLLLHGLGVEMAEALAEYWHKRIREEWGFVAEDGPTVGGLFRQQYRGGRYSWGYPACPELEDNVTVAQLLGADRLGIEVSEETGWQYQPEQTTSALICHHPQAKYFVAR